MRKILIATPVVLCSLWCGAKLRPNLSPLHLQAKETRAAEASTATAAGDTKAASTAAPKRPQGGEVVIGARAWRYDRVYPLLDGLFQDVVSSSVTQLTLNNNAANAANLNALVQSLQIQAGYNQLSGVQNSVASQMAVANLGYQSLLAQQAQGILQQQLTAQQQLGQATQDQTNAQNNKDQAAYDAATAKIQTLNSTLASLNAQSALIKSPTTPWSPTAASGNIANPTTAFSTIIPSSILSGGTLTGGPSFPPTKQLDNQVDLLWSRLARVVGTMSQPDSGGPDDKLFLIEFSTATFPNQSHEKYLLDTTYDLTCDNQTEAEYMPTVVDIFPRVAALNIVNTRYKDQGFNLGAVASFLGFGVNGAYNREHLRMTQLLGQSSYITGYGVGQSHFGWKFGIPLGDKVISSDIKKTFALIRVPSKCAQPTLSFDQVWWGKQQKKPRPDDSESNAVKAELTPELKAIKTTMQTTSTSGDPFVEQINFNRTVYDPTKYSSTSPVPVSLVMHFSDNLDSQILVYANGVLIKRARDTFGRAVSSASTPGLLESSSLTQVNTWLPTSSKSLLLNLDGGQFGETFPTIMIVPPSQQTITVGPDVTSDTEITVSGRAFHCIQARCNLPSIAYRQTTPARITATRWSPAMNDDYKVVFRTKSTPQPLSVSSNAPSSVQLVTGSEQQDWGTNAEVYAIVDDDSQDGSSNQVKLQCDPTASSGQRLVCDMGSILPQVSFGDVQSNATQSVAASTDPAGAKYALVSGQLPPGMTLASNGIISGTPTTRGAVGFSVKVSGNSGEKEVQRKYLGFVGPTGWLLEPKRKITFHIIDEGHSGGPLEGWTELPQCSSSTDCLQPTIWSISNPVWSDQKNGWDLTIQVVNVDVTTQPQVRLQLKVTQAQPLLDKSHSGIYSAVFSIPAKDISKWYDTVAMTVDGLNADLKLLNIHSLIAPVVTYINTDSTSWSGQNLTNLFRYVEVGSSTKGVPISCPVITACAVNGGASAMPTKQTGVLYVASSADPKSPDFIEQPLMKLNTNGTLSPISYQPPTKDKSAKTVVVGTSQTPSTTTPGQPASGTPGQTTPATTPQLPAQNQQRTAQIAIQ